MTQESSSLEDVMAQAQQQAKNQADLTARAASESAAAERAAAESASADRAAAAAAGNSAAPASEAVTAEAASSAPQTYVVQAGDSLSSISQKVYGDAKHWDTIFEHNKDKISDPDVVHPGQELTIP